MTTDRSSQRWSNATLAGAGTATLGAGIIASQSGSGRKRDLKGPKSVFQQEADLTSSRGRFNQMRSAKASGAEVDGKPVSQRRVTFHGNAVAGHLKRRGAAEAHDASVKSAMKVRRVGSGALGAGLTLSALGAVMAERKRRPKKVVQPEVRTGASRVVHPPLKDYRAMVSQGGLLANKDGHRMDVPRSSDWIKANGGRT